ncbi:cation:proton antiporter [Desulforhopalus sp. 52FAK]
MEIKDIVLLFAYVVTASTLCQWIAWKLKLPAIIFLLSAGLLAGPVFNILNPDILMGPLLLPFISLSVAIILFEGSLTLKLRDILHLQSVLRNMLTIGLLITWLITSLSAKLLTGVSWEIATLFGAITVVTGPTVIAPLLRSVRPTAPIANILRWEGIVIDPIGASLAVLVYEFIVSGGGQAAWGHTLLTFTKIVSVGFVTGVTGGYIFGLALRNHLLPEFLKNVATLSIVFFFFASANYLQPESGLITVTVLGIWLANMKGVDIDSILHFKEHLSILLVSLLFIMLSSRLEFSTFREIGWGALSVFLVVQFLARPVNVMLSAIGSGLTIHERHFLAWVAPRGIVAAAIASLFALGLEQAGVANAHLLVPLTFSVIIGTVLLQSFTAGPVAKFLGVAEPEPLGFIIIGANVVARSIGKILSDCGVRVVLADTSREHIQAAAGDGLETYLGNPMSEHAERHLDMTGIGSLLAISPYESVNFGAVMHFRGELGNNNVFLIRSQAMWAQKSHRSSKSSVSNDSTTIVSARKKTDSRFLPGNNRGRLLFDAKISYLQFSEALASGAELIKIVVDQNTSVQEIVEKKSEHLIPLFFIDQKDHIHIITAQENNSHATGGVLVALQQGKELQQPVIAKSSFSPEKEN